MRHVLQLWAPFLLAGVLAWGTGLVVEALEERPPRFILALELLCACVAMATGAAALWWWL